MRGEPLNTAMKFQNRNLAEIAAPALANESTDPFFADAVDPQATARHQTLDAIARLLVWLSDEADCTHRGIRATIALYCLRPELVSDKAARQVERSLTGSTETVGQLAKCFSSSFVAE